MSKEKKQISRMSKNEAMIALDDICDKYKKINTTGIEKFAPVYYPIAIVEMNLDELTFENFEMLQYTILKIISLGIKDPDVIAETLGLSSKYVIKMIRLLHGYGHLDDNGIAELGKLSLKQGKKVTQSQVLQKFQLDALNGTLLKVEQTITETMLNDREQTSLTIGHLNYLDGLPVQEISMQLAKNNLSTYVHQKSGIINTNVTRINDVRCTEVKYARCYLMKIKNCDEPFIFAKRYDTSKKDIKERFSWQPFGLKNTFLRETYGFEEDIPLNTEIARKYINHLYSMLLERGDKVNVLEEAQSVMQKIYPFEEEGIRIDKVDDVIVPIINVDEKAFRVYRSWLINFLVGIKNDREYLITNERMYGHLVSLRTESSLMIYLADLLNEKINTHGKSAVINHLKDKYKNYDGDSLIEGIVNELLIL